MPDAPRRSGDPDPRALAAACREGAHVVSVCIPACDEEATIGPIVETIRRDLVDDVGLVTEIIVVDDGSTDATAAVAAAAGAHVVAEAEVLPETGPGSGKGNALWKSLHVSSGDIVCWLDGDVSDFRAHFVTRLVAPLVADPAIALVKGYYRRPLGDDPVGGGRVNELVARPLLSHLFPKLADVVQPLAGEYAGRRDVLEAVPFVEGWGVEFGLLVDVAERCGRASIAQADLGVRVHRNRTLAELSRPALAILVTALRRAGLDPDDDPTATLVRFDDAHRLETVDVEVRERPPMLSVPAYRSSGRARSAAGTPGRRPSGAARRS